MNAKAGASPFRRKAAPQPNGHLLSLYRAGGLRVPAALRDWPEKIEGFCREYERATPGALIVEAERDGRVYLFDLGAARERLVCSYGVSAPGAGEASGLFDADLLPQVRPLDRESLTEGEHFRQMERYAAERGGTFFYQRPLYASDGWIPDQLECGVLRNDREWWVERIGDVAGR